ncbi:MAG TPA: AraC family transcriptional regulator, partial [Candidatus Eisenbergiella merdipullorum]|nr:AraC family transcriptional regulator [Candidatus Eisenbergiella merdipullorum]
MTAIRTSFMSGDDERQYMIREDYEIYEKYGAPTGATDLHYHDFYELIYILDGEFSSLVDNVTFFLKKGDFLLIGRNVLHKYHYIEGKHARSRRIVLWISRQMLDRLSEGEQDLSLCFERRKGAVYRFPLHYEGILHEMLVRAAMTDVPDLEGMKGKRLYDRAQLTLFFLYLNELCEKDAFSSGEKMRVHHELVEQVNAYIDEHIQETISLDELAGQAHMSKYYFLRRFKELTGTTVHAYLNNKRLIRCGELLQQG